MKDKCRPHFAKHQNQMCQITCYVNLGTMGMADNGVNEKLTVAVFLKLWSADTQVLWCKAQVLYHVNMCKVSSFLQGEVFKPLKYNKCVPMIQLHVMGMKQVDPSTSGNQLGTSSSSELSSASFWVF